MGIRSRHVPFVTSPASKDYRHRRRASGSGSTAERRIMYRLALHGIARDEYDNRVAMQGGLCATCGQKPGVKGLVIDLGDDGEFRELLCHRCKIVLGLVRNNAQICTAIAQYLTDWQPVVKDDTMADVVSGSATP